MQNYKQYNKYYKRQINSISFYKRFRSLETRLREHSQDVHLHRVLTTQTYTTAETFLALYSQARFFVAYFVERCAYIYGLRHTAMHKEMLLKYWY